MRQIIVLILFFAANSAQALGLDDYLGVVMAKHHMIQANEQGKEAATYHRIADDTMFGTQLNLNGSYLNDQKPLVFLPTFLETQNTGWTYNAGLSKLFETGTQAGINLNLQNTNLTFDNPGGTPQYTNTGYATGALGVTLSQSLWKNAFGSATELRLERERRTEQWQKENFNLQTKQILVDAEAAFWDLLYLQEEQKLRDDNLQRSKKIVTWVKNRFGNGIGDRADVLNAEGLQASRELELIQTEDNIIATRRKVTDMMELTSGEKPPTLEGNLAQLRELDTLVAGREFKGSAAGRRVRLDSYLTVLDAKTKAISSKEADDSMKPDLVFNGSYATNSYDPNNSIPTAYNNVYQTNTPTVNLGLKLVWLLDNDLKNANREAAKRDALSASLSMERQLLESDSAWQEMNRHHAELTREVDAARMMAEIQKRKATAEREKLERGRAITSDVVLAEQDAAESALTLTRLQASQRKLESQARMYVSLPEVP